MNTKILLFVAAAAVLVSCSSFAVTPPAGFYLSTGDYVDEVETIGIIQTHKSVWAPFVLVYDINSVREDLYEELLDKVKGEGADGITNVQFYSKTSALTVATFWILGLTVYDFYVEGVAIRKK